MDMSPYSKMNISNPKSWFHFTPRQASLRAPASKKSLFGFRMFPVASAMFALLLIAQLWVPAAVGAVTIGFANADYIVDGSNDHVQIQQAVNAVAAAGGGEVFFYNGIYSCGAEIVVPKDARIKFVGEKVAKGTTGGVILRAGISYTNLISIAGSGNPVTNAGLTHDIHFEHLTLNGNGKVTNVVKLTNADYIGFSFCRIVGGVNGIATAWDSTSDTTDATIPGGLFINNCILSAGAGGIALDLQHQTQCWISNVWFSGPGGAAVWINIKSSNKIHIANCEFNTVQQAFRFQDTATKGCHDITVVGCIFAVGTGNKCWTDQRTNTSSRRVLIASCINSHSASSYDPLAGGIDTPQASIGF